MLKTLSLWSYGHNGFQYSSHLRILLRNQSLVQREQHTELCCRQRLLLCKQHIRLCWGDSKWQRASLCWPSIMASKCGRGRQGKAARSWLAYYLGQLSWGCRATRPSPGKKTDELSRVVCRRNTKRLLFALQQIQCHLSQVSGGTWVVEKSEWKMPSHFEDSNLNSKKEGRKEGITSFVLK